MGQGWPCHYMVKAKYDKMGVTFYFYPHYRLDCHLSYIGDKVRTPCLKCGGRNCVNHKRQILKDVSKCKCGGRSITEAGE